MIWHSTHKELNQYADGELSTARRGRVAKHLARCPACREIVDSIEALAKRVDELPTKSPPDGVLERILERRAAGDRVILPTGGVSPRRRLPLVPLAAAAAVALLVIGVPLVNSVSKLSAGRIWGDVMFTPADPERGADVTIEYRRTAILGDADVLVLRARYRRPGDESYDRSPRQQVVGRLERVGSQLYRGRFTLPDSVVYAVFAVEDEAGERVDHNGQRLWELLAHRDGKPELDALIQRHRDLMGRNWEVAFETARRVSELYPDKPGVWSTVRFFEEIVLGEHGADSLRSVHHARIGGFHEQLSERASLSGDDLGAMYRYASGARDSVTAKYWRQRLLAEAPEHPLAIQELVIEVFREHYEHPQRVLVEFERLWQEYGSTLVGGAARRHPSHRQLPRQGYYTALRVGDPAQIRRWAERRLSVEPTAMFALAIGFAEKPALRAEGLEMLRARLKEIHDLGDARRSLRRTVQDQEPRDQAARRRVYAVLGKALVDDGQTASGLDTLALAAQDGWDLSVFRTIADVRLGLGDTANAMEAMAHIAVDPNTRTTTLDSIAGMATSAVGDDRWTELRQRARAEMRDRTLRSAVTRSLRRRARVVDGRGERHSLEDLAQGTVTFVAFWSRYCGPSLQQLPQLQRVADQLEEHGVRVIAITDEAPSDDVRQFLSDKELTLPVYHDTRGEAKLALDSWGTPEHFLLDQLGRVRFAYGSLNEVMRQVEALLGGSSPETGQMNVPKEAVDVSQED